MKPEDVDVLLVGCGHVALNQYVPACQALGMSVVGVVDPDERRRAQVARSLGHPAVFDHIPAAGLATRAPLALNLAPVPLHSSVTTELMAAGWNVLSEKPAAQSPAQWQELLATAREEGLTVLSAPFTHLSPPVRDVRRWLERTTGDTEVRLDTVRGGPAADGMIEDHRRWFFDLGQGPLWDLAVYGATVLVGLFGPPATVRAIATARPRQLTVLTAGERRTDTAVVHGYDVSLAWPGVTATMQVGYDDAPRDTRNLVARRGSRMVAASIWDYGLDVRSDGDAHVDTAPIDTAPRETRKYVHGLREACLLLSSPDRRAAHRALVGDVLALLSTIAASAHP